MNLSFKEGDWVDYETWKTEFNVSGRSGINISKANHLIVCVTDNPPYEDDWYSNDEWDGVRFVGQGLEGDQIMNRANKNLKESLNSNTTIHVLRKALNKEGKSQYLYCGIFVLKTAPRDEFQNDKNGQKRRVIVFNLAAKKGRLNEEAKNAMIQNGLTIRKIG